MCLKFVSLALMCLGGLAAQRLPVAVKDKRQVGVGSVEVAQDHAPAETGFHGFPHQNAAQHHQGSKYFQYIHMPAKDHYEHGHKRGNDHHFIERHEKGHPHNGEFKNKVRWGDKHGGYGEHYWDYNHAGHGKEHESDGEESQRAEAYETYPEESKEVPLYGNPRGKRNPEDDVEFISDQAKSSILNDKAPKHGGNYRRAKDARPKREPQTPQGLNLIFDQESGLIVDQSTGVQYQLQAVPSIPSY